MSGDAGGEGFDLGGGNILPDNKDALIERHVPFLPLGSSDRKPGRDHPGASAAPVKPVLKERARSVKARAL